MAGKVFGVVLQDVVWGGWPLGVASELESEWGGEVYKMGEGRDGL